MILAVLQARISSTRLPGKVLRPILGVPMLVHQIERVLRAKLIDKLIVATSTDKSDDLLEQVCQEHNIECFRGSLDNVLERFYTVAKFFSPEHIVRLTGDCPLADPEIIDRVISYHLKGNYDYTSNALEPTFPDGLDVEILRFNVLERVSNEAISAAQQEHVTLYIYQHPELFKIGVVKNEVDLSAFRWTVDEQQDFELVEKIYQNIYSANPCFTMGNILEFITNHPEFQTSNAMFKRNEGLERSLRKELDGGA